MLKINQLELQVTQLTTQLVTQLSKKRHMGNEISIKDEYVLNLSFIDVVLK